VKVRALKNLKDGIPAGYSISVGCMDFWVGSEEEARREVIAIANDPVGHERAYYDRCRRKVETGTATAGMMKSPIADYRRDRSGGPVGNTDFPQAPMTDEVGPAQKRPLENR
jgi:hypothetical protein